MVLSNSKGATSLPANWLYKSHAENNGYGDTRAEKPVMIAPVKAAAIELKGPDGRVIETLRYYGSYSDNKRWRYYGTRWGFETLAQIRGGTSVTVWVNGKKVGSVNPAFRAVRPPRCRFGGGRRGAGVWLVRGCR